MSITGSPTVSGLRNVTHAYKPAMETSSRPRMSSGGEVPRQNVLRSALQRGQFLCTAELVLGRDHNMADAEAFVKAASQQEDGMKVISVTDLPSGNPALPPQVLSPTSPSTT